MLKKKNLIMFDLDGTLTASKKVLDKNMATLFCQILGETHVAVMSGANYPQFQNQFLHYLNCNKEKLKNLYLLPVSGGSLYTYQDSKWQLIYKHSFRALDKAKILNAFNKVFHDISYPHPKKIYGEVIEDRESQVTFSALGQKAPLERKKEWSMKNDIIRRKMKKALEKYLPDFEVRLGGLTSIDITKKGIDKAYGVEQIIKLLSLSKKEVVYVGDALYRGGNDYAVKRARIDTVSVNGPEETKKFIHSLFKTQATLTCPLCGATQTAEIPTGSCMPFYKCQKCNKLIRAKGGDCCVFCSYGNKKCPLKNS